jgi:hypothetical protein
MPSKYLLEIKAKNPNIVSALHSHMLTADLLSGDHDKNYDFFLEERAEAILAAMRVNMTEAGAEHVERLASS